MDGAAEVLLGALGTAAITGLATYLAAVVPARRAARDARAANDVLRQELAETKAEHARGWLLHIDEMCRSDDRRQRRIGLRLLRATISTIPTDPAVRAVLEELTQEHVGWTLEGAEDELRAGGELVILPPQDVDPREEDADDDVKDDPADD